MIKRLLATLAFTALCALNLPAADELERGFAHATRLRPPVGLLVLAQRQHHEQRHHR